MRWAFDRLVKADGTIQLPRAVAGQVVTILLPESEDVAMARAVAVKERCPDCRPEGNLGEFMADYKAVAGDMLRAMGDDAATTERGHVKWDSACAAGTCGHLGANVGGGS